MEVAQKKMGISRGVYSFTQPLGATINMDGAAIYEGVCAVAKTEKQFDEKTWNGTDNIIDG